MSPLSFSGIGFAKGFAASRAKRWLDEFFTQMGDANLRYLLEKDKDFSQYIPQESLKSLRSDEMAQTLSQHFTNQEIYLWLPARGRAIIESYPNGRAWADRQFEFLKQCLRI